MAGPLPVEVAPGVFQLRLGTAITEANVYLLATGADWVLVDAGWPRQAEAIRIAARLVFGDRPPSSIVLTHFHPDHSGGVPQLLRTWDAPVLVHPDELPFARGGYDPSNAHPLDRFVVAPILRLIPVDRVEAARERTSLEGAAVAYDPAAPLPGLPEWRCIPTPGHTRGHAAYYRESDGVLLTGDAVLTINTNNPVDLVRGHHDVFAPPRITTWNWARAQDSRRSLLALQPSVICSGHGPVLRHQPSGRDAS